MSIRVLAVLGAVSVVGGCCGDDGERPPWERDAGRTRTASDASAGRVADAAPAFAFVQGQVDLEGSRATIELGGARVTPGGLVRAWLEADLDGDGDADAVVLQAQPPPDEQTEPTLELLTYRRDDTELDATGGQPLGAGPIRDVTLRLDAPGAVTLTLTTTPAATAAPASPSPEAPAAPGQAEPPRSVTLATMLTGPFPLVPRVSARLEGSAASIAMSARDQDGDGRPDAVLAVDRGGARAEVVWLDRTAGPSIDPAVTERSLAALVPPPGGRKRLDASVPRALAIVEVRRLLCTGELEGSTLQLQDRPARECRPSRATGQAIAVLVRAHANAGRIPQARAALGFLQMEGVSLGEQARAALEQLVNEHTTLAIDGTLIDGPRVEPAAGLAGPRPPSAGPLLRFLDDDRLWVDASPPFVYYLSSAQVQAADPLPSSGHTQAPTTPPPAYPEARAALGTRRAVGTAEGLWLAQDDRWALLPRARFGGSWLDVTSLAMAPSGEAVAALRDGRIAIVTLRLPGPVPVVLEGRGGETRDGGGGDASTTGERGP